MKSIVVKAITNQQSAIKKSVNYNAQTGNHNNVASQSIIKPTKYQNLKLCTL